MPVWLAAPIHKHAIRYRPSSLRVRVTACTGHPGTQAPQPVQAGRAK
ncbi:hypothetical protein YPPY64_3594, partial [Yersinia pestis PY-64]